MIADFSYHLQIHDWGLIYFHLKEENAWDIIMGSFMVLFCLVFAMFCARLFICALWSPAGKGLTS